MQINSGKFTITMNSLLQYLSTKLLIGLVIAVAVVAAAGSYDLREQQQLVKTNQVKWNNFLNSTSCGAYTMKFARSCFCLPDWRGPYQVVVNSTGGVASAVYMYGSDQYAGKIVQGAGKALTVRDVFDEIKRALNQKADGLEVTYDEDRGSPKEVFIDWEELATDEEDRYTIENVVPL